MLTIELLIDRCRKAEKYIEVLLLYKAHPDNTQYGNVVSIQVHSYLNVSGMFACN